MRPILLDLPLPFGWHLPFPAYGTFLVLGMLAAVWVSGAHGPVLGLRRRDVFDLGIWLLAAALVGAHLFHIAYHPEAYFAAGWREGLKRVFLPGPGLVYYGGLAAAFPVLWFWGKRRRLPYVEVLDFVAPLGSLGLGITRLGCFFNGCCYGAPTTWGWAVQFPEASLAHRQQVAKGLIASHQPTLPVHPVQLAEAAFALLLFAWLWWRFPRRRFRGEVVVTFGVAYGLWRLFAEALRADAPGWTPGGFGLTPSQGVSLFLLAAALFAAWKLSKSVRPS